MKTLNLALIIVTFLFLISCCNNQNSKVSSNDTIKTETKDSIVNTTVINNDGEKLNLVFNNTKDFVLVCLEDDTVKLTGQKPASGIWYKNDNYELLGKGNDIELKKDGVVIFEHIDNVVFADVNNNNGDTLSLRINNTTGVVKAYLNGGVEIEMNKQETESGEFYKNNDYELTKDENSYKLTKNNKIIFEN